MLHHRTFQGSLLLLKPHSSYVILHVLVGEGSHDTLYILLASWHVLIGLLARLNLGV